MRTNDPESLLEIVHNRTAQSLFCLHYAQTEAGVYCLDFGISAATIEELNERAVQACRDLLPEQEIAAVESDERWRALLDPAKFEYQTFFALPVQAASGYPVIAVVLKGEF
jgi:hypothetical protein